MTPGRAAVPYTQFTTTTQQLPCCHILGRYFNERQPYPLQLIPPPWRLFGEEEPSEPFNSTSWVRAYHVGDRFQLLRQAKLPPCQPARNPHASAAASLVCDEPQAEVIIRKEKRLHRRDS